MTFNVFRSSWRWGERCLRATEPSLLENFLAKRSTSSLTPRLTRDHVFCGTCEKKRKKEKKVAWFDLLPPTYHKFGATKTEVVLQANWDGCDKRKAYSEVVFIYTCRTCWLKWKCRSSTALNLYEWKMMELTIEEIAVGLKTSKH